MPRSDSDGDTPSAAGGDPHSLPVHGLYDLDRDVLLLQCAQHAAPPVLPAFEVYHEDLAQGGEG